MERTSKSALVIGASSGVGKATAKALVSAGWRVVGVARGARGLDALRLEVPAGLEVARADASEPGVAERLIAEHRPEVVVLAGGARPKMAPLTEQSWESFSEPWNNDARAAFYMLRAAVALPLAPGATVVVVSSGAAVNGSPFSGGYAGAKRMQWLLTGYAQKLADARQLGLRFVTLVPRQMLEGSEIAAEASAAYGAAQGISPAEFMKRFGPPLTAEGVSAVVGRILFEELGVPGSAVTVTSQGVEVLA